MDDIKSSFFMFTTEVAKIYFVTYILISYERNRYFFCTIRLKITSSRRVMNKNKLLVLWTGKRIKYRKNHSFIQKLIRSYKKEYFYQCNISYKLLKFLSLTLT